MTVQVMEASWELDAFVVSETENLMTLVLVDSGAKFGREAVYARAEGVTLLSVACGLWGCHFTSANESFSSWNPEEMKLGKADLYRDVHCPSNTLHSKCWLPSGMPWFRGATTVRAKLGPGHC